MRKRAVVLVMTVLCILCFGMAQGQEILWQQISRENLNVTAVAVDSGNPADIYVAADNSVLKTEDRGLSWINILSIRGQNRAINFLCLSPRDGNSLYAVTGNGLYYSQDRGKNWQRIFRGKDSWENACTAVAVLPDAIFVGTKAGLFISKDNGRSWLKAGARLGESQIFCLAYSFKEPDYLYVACVDGVFKTADGGKSWDRVFVALPTEKSLDEGQDENQENNHEEKISQVKYISLDLNNPSSLYLATSRGVYKSRDRANTWELLSSSGLPGSDIRFVLVSHQSRVLVLTKSGVYVYEDIRWQELSLRLPVEEVKFLASDNQENLYAACDKGLFKAQFENPVADKHSILTLYYKDEPKINQVQEVAVRYAEVEPEKISRWRRQATRRALLPKLTISFDQDKDKTISKSVWGIYSSYSNGNITAPGRYFIGPDDETKYRNKNYGVSLSWDFGDLIWSDDQTSIDVRSRLMVQLREDILDEVNKLYFERIRLKMEIDRLSIEDRVKRLEKELRLAEFTASLDALTGGYYSECLNSK
jgi:phosphoribosyl-AMP cyclohydrolase